MKVKSAIGIFLFFIIFSCHNESDNIEIANYPWENITFSEANVDEIKIRSALIKGESLNFLYSILIIRYGKIIAEKYYNGHKESLPCNIKSVSKSFLSTAIGTAIEKNIISLDEKLTDIVTDYNLSINDERFFDITLNHLIMMKSGLDKDINIYSSVYNSNNWLSTIFRMNLIKNPGEKFIYSTPGTHLISSMLSKASGKNSFEYVTENLLSKMKVELNYWERDPQGIYFGGNSMYFTTRNMAVLGLVYLNNGLLNGHQIVPEYWIKISINDHTGGIGDWGVIKNMGYGYLWWLGEINNHKIFTAIGHGGQFILCVPELSLIVATNAKSNISWEEANQQELAILEIIGNHIFPAVNL
jgi:CubicO group peptidase (beta-lactamase class C family)